MRKKIPTVTRPDPAYAASLRQDFEEAPRREDAERSVIASESSGANVETAERTEGPQHSALPFLAQQTSVESGPEIVTPPAAQCLRTRRLPATRKVDIRVNALERQEEALIDCGVDPAHVIRAALRRAVKTWKLDPHFVAPSEEPRTRITEWRARTSLAVDVGAVTALLRAHDPLDVLSKWTLIRGQVEPCVWAEIDAILIELGHEQILPCTTRA
jgi:hypothetical protein